MENREQKVRDFFSSYEERFNTALADKGINLSDVTNDFSECFIESSPLGVICGKNDETFQDKISGGFTFYRNLGTTAMNIENISITALNEAHMMATVDWKYTAKRKDESEVVIHFEIIYLLRTTDNEIRIFAYITGDEQKALRENGLLV